MSTETRTLNVTYRTRTLKEIMRIVKEAEDTYLYRGVSDAAFKEERATFRTASVFSRRVAEMDSRLSDGEFVYMAKKLDKDFSKWGYSGVNINNNYSAEAYGLCCLLKTMGEVLTLDAKLLKGKKCLFIVSCDCAPALGFVDRVFYYCFHKFKASYTDELFNLNSHIQEFESNWDPETINVNTIKHFFELIEEACSELKTLVRENQIKLHLAFFHVRGHMFKPKAVRYGLYESTFFGLNKSVFRIMSDHTPLSLYLNNLADVLANEKSNFGELETTAKCSQLRPKRIENKLITFKIRKDRLVGLYHKIMELFSFDLSFQGSRSKLMLRLCSHYVSICETSDAAFHF